jgi:hypothetical protein
MASLEQGRGGGFEILRRFAKARPEVERCDLCGLEIGPRHDHLIDPAQRRLACACGACAVLFSAQEGTRYKRVPREVLALDQLTISDAQWEALRLPIDLAFFYHSTPQGRVVACYPSPAGATESLLELETWEEIQREHPVLAGLQPDVQALLVNRVRRGSDRAAACFLVPIDQCFRLVGIIRMHWKGFTGGAAVWEEIDRFFEELGQHARPPKAGLRA